MGAPRPMLVVVPSGVSAERDGTLARSRLPHLQRLGARATFLKVRTTPDGLPPGTEVGLPTMLGVRVGAPPSRGYLDATALGMRPLDGSSAWRLDLHRDGRPWAPPDPVDATNRLTEAIGAPVNHVRGHRFVLVGPRAWGEGPHAPRAVRPRRPRRQPWRRRLSGLRHALPGVEPTVWGLPNPVRWRAPVPRPTRIVAVEGSVAVGVARVGGLPARVVDRGAGHHIDELRGLAAAARDALEGADAPIVVVHTHHVDDAAHRGRRADRVAALELLDRELLGPVLGAARQVGAAVWWCPDHGTDPRTGRHTAAPVPSVFTRDASHGAARHLHPLSDRVARFAPSADARTLLASLLRLADPDVA